MREIKVGDDLATISKDITASQYKYISRLSILDIASNMITAKKNLDLPLCADIGIGNLIINCEGDEISYKFIPTRRFEKTVSDAVKHNKDAMVEQIEKETLRTIVGLQEK